MSPGLVEQCSIRKKKYYKASSISTQVFIFSSIPARTLVIVVIYLKALLYQLTRPILLKCASFLNKNVKSLGTVLVLPFGWTVHLRKWRLGFFYSTRYNLSHSWWNASQQPPGTCLSLTPPQKIREITNYVQLISWQNFYRHYCTYTKFWEYRSWAKSIF